VKKYFESDETDSVSQNGESGDFEFFFYAVFQFILSVKKKFCLRKSKKYSTITL